MSIYQRLTRLQDDNMLSNSPLKLVSGCRKQNNSIGTVEVSAIPTLSGICTPFSSIYWA
jgi:hypothetical protein